MTKFAYTKINLYENSSCEKEYLRKVISFNSEKLMTGKFKEKVSNTSEVNVTVAL